MPYNTKIHGKNPYNAGEVEKKEALVSSTKHSAKFSLASPNKKAKLDTPASPSKKSRKREGDEIDNELKSMKKKVNNQINELNGMKPSEITPKPNFSKYRKRGAKKVGGKKVSKKYNEQKRKNILKNIDSNNLKHVRCVVNSEILNKGLCKTIKSLGPEKIKNVLKKGKTQSNEKK
ncbi:hypothetical protein BCR36DRAFT_584757 [Piromyces finnis]|uniref:Uncharacterized protein n=1 Tax=Piromyces finnis TaxID=1754191 RepID=A0A1Y1V657_9FUNG|nr:hypothetical protein BCR36DRAFT_584757 [Piromyces finnis]|eukprot:ORX47656.1 hypothetical protein BCR36DRAFT_584757 [Piromyces finnis]